MKTSVVEVPPKDAELSCTFVANTTALKGIFQRLATQFGSMYKRKAFLHWYKGEGMDEMEFRFEKTLLLLFLNEICLLTALNTGGSDSSFFAWGLKERNENLKPENLSSRLTPDI